MEFPVSYDITRIGTRIFSSSPNGIHRVDETLARYFLNRRDHPTTGTWFPRPFPHRMTSRAAALEVLEGVDEHLDEQDDPSLEPFYQSIKAWVLASGSVAAQAPLRLHHRRRQRLGPALAWVLKGGIGASAARRLPKDARYINVSHFGLNAVGAFDWLGRRPDVKALFFIHDMLPFETPEYFVKAELERRHVRMRNLARFGAAAVVSTQVVKTALLAHLASLGRSDMPVLVSPPPVAPIFRVKIAPDDQLAAKPFFVQCGTIEPRKNHLMILHVWRELVARHGAAAPKLILVGARGWENENIIDLLERAPALRGYVLEVAGLPTPILRRLLGSAKALLMPSFAEGYGLPLAEALAAGAPVIASDIPVFREVAGHSFLALSRIDAAAWLQAIEQFSGLTTGDVLSAKALSHEPVKPESFFSDVYQFAQSL